MMSLLGRSLVAGGFKGDAPLLCPLGNCDYGVAQRVGVHLCDTLLENAYSCKSLVSHCVSNLRFDLQIHRPLPDTA